MVPLAASRATARWSAKPRAARFDNVGPSADHADPPAAPPTTDRAAVFGRSTDLVDEYETRDTAERQTPVVYRTYLTK